MSYFAAREGSVWWFLAFAAPTWWLALAWGNFSRRLEEAEGKVTT